MDTDLIPTRVTANPQVRSGQTIIRGTRITVWDILGWLASGLPESAILSGYPELKSEDIRAALKFAYQLKDKLTPNNYPRSICSTNSLGYRIFNRG